ncbi:MAG: PFL family protein [Actinomycetaceae bacterium]|nr:PFL family protein [Arcanobacterium sp.]MDD7687438.1 PFL family protein [Actinomycetaceae bacterium]MDY5272912.1 PFL family protein [Arcanobacterium sp.]
MAMDTESHILDTIRMISEDNLDVRTVTMGISLLGCADSDVHRACARIEETIMRGAENLVSVADAVAGEFGVPVINKRITVTPIALVAAASGATKAADVLPYAHALDRAGKAVGVDFVGGYSALVEKGRTSADQALMESIPEALASTDIVCSSVNVGSTRTGINMAAAAQMGQQIKRAAELTASSDGLGAAKLVVFANAVGDNPFMAGGFHGVGEAESVINVGVSGPGVVERAIRTVRGRPFEEVAEAIKTAAFKITRMGQLVGTTVAERLGVRFGIVDLSLAPTSAIGDSVAAVLEEMGIEQVGAPGTTAALALLNDAVKKGGLMACGSVGGLSGSFIPVSEDINMIHAAAAGAISIAKLEAMTAICSVGLDMIALPGSTSAAAITGLIADECAIGIANQKTTAVRVIPVPGKDVGEKAEFGGLLGWAPIMALPAASSEVFAARGGRIPAPIHAFKN